MIQESPGSNIVAEAAIIKKYSILATINGVHHVSYLRVLTQNLFEKKFILDLHPQSNIYQIFSILN